MIGGSGGKVSTVHCRISTPVMSKAVISISVTDKIEVFVTASICGFYCIPNLPSYTAAKQYVPMSCILPRSVQCSLSN
jgi:hypothetical protein